MATALAANRLSFLDFQKSEGDRDVVLSLSSKIGFSKTPGCMISGTTQEQHRSLARITSLEKTLEYVQEQHSATIAGLYSEIARLQNISTFDEAAHIKRWLVIEANMKSVLRADTQKKQVSKCDTSSSKRRNRPAVATGVEGLDSNETSLEPKPQPPVTQLGQEQLGSRTISMIQEVDKSIDKLMEEKHPIYLIVQEQREKYHGLLARLNSDSRRKQAELDQLHSEVRLLREVFALANLDMDVHQLQSLVNNGKTSGAGNASTKNALAQSMPALSKLQPKPQREKHPSILKGKPNLLPAIEKEREKDHSVDKHPLLGKMQSSRTESEATLNHDEVSPPLDYRIQPVPPINKGETQVPISGRLRSKNYHPVVEDNTRSDDQHSDNYSADEAPRRSSSVHTDASSTDTVLIRSNDDLPTADHSTTNRALRAASIASPPQLSSPQRLLPPISPQSYHPMYPTDHQQEKLRAVPTTETPAAPINLPSLPGKRGHNYSKRVQGTKKIREKQWKEMRDSSL
ncbi:hypothetical protein BJ742DRAFT_883665 [Cladochytrium replicatum]|nr:hypothetical protein BJ742DRAFT_883665 [Cladochytrium replicatum]